MGSIAANANGFRVLLLFGNNTKHSVLILLKIKFMNMFKCM